MNCIDASTLSSMLATLFLLLFLTLIVCQHHLCDVWLYGSSLVFLFSGPFVEVLPSSTFLSSWLGLLNTPTAPLQRDKNTPPHTTSVLIYDTKQSDGEVPVMLELWGMQSTPSLPSLPDPLWPRVVTPDRAVYVVK